MPKNNKIFRIGDDRYGMDVTRASYGITVFVWNTKWEGAGHDLSREQVATLRDALTQYLEE